MEVRVAIGVDFNKNVPRREMTVVIKKCGKKVMLDGEDKEKCEECCVIKILSRMK